MQGVSGLNKISSEQIVALLRSEIANYEIEKRTHDIGSVTYVGDGIATIKGLDHAMYGEIVVFENGVKGMVQDVRKNEIGCILFDLEGLIKEGTKVTRTQKMASVPVG